MVCDMCGGIGYYRHADPYILQWCPKCHGKREVDWTEEILGVDYNDVDAELFREQIRTEEMFREAERLFRG